MYTIKYSMKNVISFMKGAQTPFPNPPMSPLNFAHKDRTKYTKIKAVFLKDLKHVLIESISVEIIP